MASDAELRARIEAQVAARRRARHAARRSSDRAPARRVGTPPPGPEPVPQPTPEPIPQPGPEPVPQPTPEPIPQPTPEPMPQPTPDPVQPPPANGSRVGQPPQPSAEWDPGTVDLSRFFEASEPQDEPTRPRRRSLARRLLRTVVIVAIAAAVAVLLRVFVVAPYYIPSGSMEPTLHGCVSCDDDHILIDKLSYRFQAPDEGDIVVFNRPPDADTPDQVLVKRVVGLPGQHLALRNGYVYVDGKRLQESYLSSAFLNKHCPGPGGPTVPTTGRSRWTVPPGDVFVMGDNRCDSMDSRSFGPIADSSIIGRAFAIIWPLGRIRLL